MSQSVLVIDDSPDIHELVKARLRQEPVALHHALGPEAGIALARAVKPDLVLLDLDLGRGSGFDVCRALKEDVDTSGTPIIFLTATADIDAKVLAFELGAVDYVTKPFDPIELRARVRSSLRSKRYLDLLATRAQVDGLTGLGNRLHFEARLQAETAAATRHDRPLAIVMFDVDHFKRINDAHGHPFGDHVLLTIGERLSTLVRSSDTACRYGGEEFIIILRETGLTGAFDFAERLRGAIAALPFEKGRATVPVSVSVGVSALELFPDPRGVTGGALVASADAALYAAKRAGRNRTLCASSVAPAAE